MLVNNTSMYCQDTKRSAMLENVDLELIDSQPSPRVLNTHLLPSALPEMTWRSQCRLVVYHRNPKDTIVSLYNMTKDVSYSKIRSVFDGTFEGYANLFLHGTGTYPKSASSYRARVSTLSQPLPTGHGYVP